MSAIPRASIALLVAVALGGVLFVWACDAPLPTAPLDETDAPAAEVVAPAAEVVPPAAVTPPSEPTEPASSDPAFTPMTVRPALSNASVVSEALAAEYPPLLRDAGIGGAPMLWVHIAATGEVDDARVFQSSGYEALDRAAMNVARTMVFTPAMNGDVVTDAWVQIPIRFSAGR